MDTVSVMILDWFIDVTVLVTAIQRQRNGLDTKRKDLRVCVSWSCLSKYFEKLEKIVRAFSL